MKAKACLVPYWTGFSYGEKNVARSTSKFTNFPGKSSCIGKMRVYTIKVHKLQEENRF